MREYLEWAIYEKTCPPLGDRLDVLTALIRSDLYNCAAGLAGSKKTVKPTDVLPDWTIDERTPEEKGQAMWNAFIGGQRALAKLHPGTVEVID